MMQIDTPWELGEWASDVYYPGGLSGLSGTGQAVALSAPQIAGGVFTTASAMGASWATAAIPIIGPVLAGVTLALGLWFNRKGPKQKVQTTQIANEVEQYLQQNLDAYFSSPRNEESKAQALSNFEAGWNALVQACGDPQMGNPGQNCVSERARGGSIPGVTGVLRPGSWWEWYYDPIAMDPGPGELPQLPGGVEVSPGINITGQGQNQSGQPWQNTATGGPGGGGNEYPGILIPALIIGGAVALYYYYS